MACLSRPSYPKKVPLNRSHFAYKRCIPFTNLASGIQNWRFAFKYAVFNLQTSISPYKLAPQITTQHLWSKSSLENKNSCHKRDKIDAISIGLWYSTLKDFVAIYGAHIER